MKRRKFLNASGVVGGVAAACSAPALAQASRPEIRWRLASSYPKSLGTIVGAAEVMSKRVAELTENRFKISVHAAGELIPPLGVLDGVQQGTVECGHSASYFYIGKDPAFGFGTAMPFGMNTRAQEAWLKLGGGLELLNDFYRAFDVTMLPLGNTGAQMAGWYRKEIKSVADLKGLKLRIGGLGGHVLSRVGVVAQQLPPGELYPALEKGVIDAAEFVGPYDDEKLGLYKIAKYYYYPGWWEGSATVSLFINQKAWAGLPPDYRAAMTAACAEANHWMTAKYDIENPPALRRLVGNGAQLRAFPKSVMDVSFKSAQSLYSEMAEKSPAFKKIYAPWVKFRDEQILWARFGETPFDSFMASTQKS